jgi:uncharacterized protein (DUF362 family)/Pyruvate/2-oxoacid:ferredoxin oxidoreductase delta subunit
MKKVVVLKIDEYNVDVIKDKIQTAILNHFSFDNLFSGQDKILLKPNLLMPSTPDEAIVTHPAVIEGVGRVFKDKGFSVSIADSPGGFLLQRDMESIYESLGVKEIAQSCGFNLLFPQENILRESIPLSWWVDQFKMVNIAKLKTHEITVLTLATKNLYGCISGLYKSHLHKMYPKTGDLIEVILKLYRMIKPSLNIVDGILALEGDGPVKRGIPRKLGVVVIGDDALYTDYVISKLVNLDENLNPLIKKAKEKGFIKDDDLEVVTELDYTITDFKFPAPFVLNGLPPFLLKLIKVLKYKPVINKEKCVGCGMCEKICPNRAIIIKKGQAVIDYKRCIVCMCCSEMCQFAAVDSRRSFFLKAINKVRSYL